MLIFGCIVCIILGLCILISSLGSAYVAYAFTESLSIFEILLFSLFFTVGVFLIYLGVTNLLFKVVSM